MYCTNYYSEFFFLRLIQVLFLFNGREKKRKVEEQVVEGGEKECGIRCQNDRAGGSESNCLGGPAVCTQSKAQVEKKEKSPGIP